MRDALRGVEKCLREGDEPDVYEQRPHIRIYPNEERAWVEFISQYLPNDRESPRILDVGAGSGLLTRILLQHRSDARVTALDPWEKGRQHAEAIPSLRAALTEGRLTWVTAETDVEAFPDEVNREAFDLVVCRLAVCSFPDPGRAFTNWLEWLKLGSYAVILDRPRSRDNWPGDWAPLSQLPLACASNAEPYREQLRQAGFEVVFARQLVGVNRAEAERFSPDDLSTACTPWYAVVGLKRAEPGAAADGGGM